MATDSSSTSGGGPVYPSHQNPLSRKLHKILESDLDNDKDTLEALKVLSDCLDKNTLKARRNLRSDLEKRTLGLNEDFLGCVKELVEQAKGLQDEANQMKQCCDDMQKRLVSAKQRTSGLLKETSQLQGRSRSLDMKSKVASSFLSKFQLTPDQLRVLSGSSESYGSVAQPPVNDEFFEAMHRVQKIHEDCKVLLHMSKQRAGLEIMESMAVQLESAYERLYHWTQNQCRLMTGEMPDFNANLRRALKELQKRPVLFQYCVDEYVIARRMALVQAFIDALTRDGMSGRPMELHSHDPVRYCGDMLGWLHQAIATENDHIAGLFAENDENSDRSVSILSMITEGSCRPLHVRIEQVIVSTMHSVVAYKLVNLLRYYCGVFLKNLSPSAPLVKTVSDLSEIQSKMFFSALNSQVSKILGDVQPPFQDLAPTGKLSELLSLLQELLCSRDMTVFAEDNQNQDLRMILSCCIDPLIQYCNASVASISKLDRSIYLVNCLYVLQSTISLFEFTDRQVENLDMQMSSHVDKVCSEQLLHFLGRTALSGFHTALSRDGVTDSDYQSIANCSQHVRTFISAPDQYHLAQLKLITSGKLREEVSKKSLERFCEVYENIYHNVIKDKGEDGVATMLSYTPQQTRQFLLS